MPRAAKDIDDETLRAAIAIDRGSRQWRCAVQAHSLGALTRAWAGGRLHEFLEEFDDRSETRAEVLAERLEWADPVRERALMESSEVGLVCVGDDDYPVMLSSVHDPPAALWMRGCVRSEAAWSLAIVGARRETAYGIEQAGRLGAAVAAADVCVVSGAARGIDAEAHRGALRAEGCTIAVVGGGLANPYPPEHVDLLDEVVAAGGAVISECPMLAEATPDRFPSRNRIIAALALGTLVVEAAARSGAIITANHAAEFGRLCMALPGPITSGRSTGCHQLIASMQAALVESSDDILRLLVEHAATVRGAETLARAGLAAPRQFQPRE